MTLRSRLEVNKYLSSLSLRSRWKVHQDSLASRFARGCRLRKTFARVERLTSLIAEVKSFVCTYALSTFDKVQNLSFFDLFPWFLPLVTFYDLDTNFHSSFTDLRWRRAWFFRKLTSRPSFWYIIYHVLTKFEKWPLSGFLTPADLLSPRHTIFHKADVKSVILIYNL